MTSLGLDDESEYWAGGGDTGIHVIFRYFVLDLGEVLLKEPRQATLDSDFLHALLSRMNYIP